MICVPSTCLPTKDLELAKQILASFHLVAITEWMKEPDHLAYFNAVLGASASAFHKQSPFLNARKQIKNMDWIDEETLRSLRELNRWDIALYNFAKALTKKRMTMQLQLIEGRKFESQSRKCPRPFPEDLPLPAFCPKCMNPRHPQGIQKTQS